jgi:hypothetical protein
MKHTLSTKREEKSLKKAFLFHVFQKVVKQLDFPLRGYTCELTEVEK